MKTLFYNDGSFAPHRCGFESRHGLWILSCEEAFQLTYSTSVVLFRCAFVSEIMHEALGTFGLERSTNDLNIVGAT